MNQLNLGMAGIHGKIEKDTLIISSTEPFKSLSSAVLGGGFLKTRHIINHHVEKDFNHSRPKRFLRKVATELGLSGGVVGMMTAAELENCSVVKMKKEGLNICAVVTGGISNAAAAGWDSGALISGAGTINTILLIGGRLSEAAMVGAVITSTEAKSAALRELDVKVPLTGQYATGTTTDAVVLAANQRGPSYKYAGTGTLLGGLIGRAVKQAVIEAVKKQEGWI